MDRSLRFDYFYGIESEQFSFIRLPKLLFRDRHFEGLSLEAKVVYGLLLDRMSLSLKNSWIDDDNRVYIIYTITSIAEDIACSKDKAGRILSELDSLKGIGLIERKRRGLGKPDIIYVKNFVKLTGGRDDESADDMEKILESTEENSKNILNTRDLVSRDRNLRFQESVDHDFKKTQNTVSGDRDLRLQETAEFSPNKTDINNTEFNDTSLLIKGSSTPIKLVDNRHLIGEDEEIMRQIKENILYDWHMETDKGSDRELYHELFEVIKDMVVGDRETVMIGKATYPYKYVRERFRSLNHEHLEYVRTEVVKNQGKIHCLKKFMETALFNAPTTINTHYSQLYTYYEEGDGRHQWEAG